MTRTLSRRAGAVPGLPLAEAQRRADGLGLGAPVAIRVSPRARRLLLRMDAATRRFELVLPPGLPPETALRFLEAQRGWIAARLDSLPARVPFAEGAVVPVLGVPHRIRREDDPAAPPVAIGDGEIRVRGGPEHVARRVRDHLVRSRPAGTGAPRANPCGADRQDGNPGHGARHEEPVGELLGFRVAVVQLAADPGAGAGARLCRRARGGASGRDEPLRAVLEAGAHDGRRSGLPARLAQAAPRRAAVSMADAALPCGMPSGTRHGRGGPEAESKIGSDATSDP